ncbi:uncharacterized protein LOC111055650 isoform X6 [Nilaparvata lugens]|uniref:uncharacterized protein LOC111055650 isoform X6 n=1 Tax=Nilaparvata lugens TaxID=108931 RepID=UPI00193CC3C6|nr:uncharacterized protein LOC111055650 isoform X6 [Nilaparvata lugens]
MLILYVLLGDHTDTLNKQTTKMQQMRNNSINVTLVLSKAVENKSNLFPGLRASRLKSNGINMLDINDSIGHVHHLC